MEKRIKRDNYWNLVEHFGNPLPKSLPSSFIGQGVKEGYRYSRWHSGYRLYFYEVTNIETRDVHYEIFERQFVGRYKNRRELYPWEEPVVRTIETSTNTNGTLCRWAELIKQ